MATDPSPPLRVRLASRLRFFAPRPVARVTVTGVLAVDPANPALSVAFERVDLNRWIVELLEVVDAALAPERFARISTLDAVVRGEYAARLETARATLAETIAASVEPVLACDGDEPAARDAAVAELRRALRGGLAGAYHLTVAVARIEEAEGPPAEPIAAPPGELPIELGGGSVTSSEGERWLAFGYAPAQLHRRSHATLSPALLAQRLEVDGSRLEAAGSLPLAAFPLLLREIPAPATISGQSAEALLPADGTPGALTHWTYTLGYEAVRAPQDSVSTRLVLGAPAPAAAPPAAEAGTELLFRALARLVVSGSAIEEALDSGLAVAQPGSSPLDPSIAGAARALDSLLSIAADTALACAALTPPTADAGLAPAPPAPAPPERPGRARLDLFLEGTGEAPAGLPVPVVSIGATQPEVVQSDGALLASYRYRTPGGAGALSYDEALSTPARTLALSLDLFPFRSAWAEVRVVRNRFLVPGVETRSGFHLASPPAPAGAAAAPSLAHPRFDLGTVLDGPAPLAAFLETFFRALLRRAEKIPVRAGLDVRLSYPLGSEMEPRRQLPIALILPMQVTPVESAVPSFADSVAARVESWTAGAGAALRPGSRFTFRLALLGGAPPGGRFLTIEDLSLDASRVVRPGAACQPVPPVASSGSDSIPLDAQT